MPWFADDTLAAVWIDRDLSWLDFNQRVLAEALDERNPLLERAKFLAIFTSNLDEFFMKRAAALRGNLSDAQRALLSSGSGKRSFSRGSNDRRGASGSCPRRLPARRVFAAVGRSHSRPTGRAGKNFSIARFRPL